MPLNYLMDEIQKKFKNLPLRIGVGIILLNKENKVFVAKRIDNPKNFWQMPQGGVDLGEDFLTAAYRELEEETSIKNVKLIKEINDSTTYLLPERLLGLIWKGKYKGQKQKWFLMRYLGEDKEINIKTTKPEFLEWKWVDIDKITETVVDFKLNVYKELKEKVKKIIS
jgi:putative (di)nucleoside polyphosphate hydrolase